MEKRDEVIEKRLDGIEKVVKLWLKKVGVPLPKEIVDDSKKALPPQEEIQRRLVTLEAMVAKIIPPEERPGLIEKIDSSPNSEGKKENNADGTSEE
jgi:hypothetical protein